MQKNGKLTVKKLVVMAMLSAISVVLTTLIHFPMFTAFLEYDPADIPIFIGTFLYGPLSGLLITVVTSVIQGLTVSAGSGWIGIVMHIAATGVFVIVFGIITRGRESLKSRLVGLVCGVVAMTLLMVLMNLIFTPLFMGAPIQTVVAMLIPAIIPFNLVKAGVNAAAAFVLFRALNPILAKFE